MGNCCCPENNESIHEGVDENSPLLRNEVSINATEQVVDAGSSSYGPRLPTEQDKVTEILNKTVTTLVDIAATCSNPENVNVTEKEESYKKILEKFTIEPLKKASLLETIDESALMATLSSSPLDEETVNFVSDTSEKMSEAVEKIHVEHYEELVVPLSQSL